MIFPSIPEQLKGAFDTAFPGFWSWYQAVKKWATNINTVVTDDNSVKLPHLADADAANDTIYYSTDSSKVVYKDSSGTVNDLY